jgi:ABC-type transport system substrate-binding protein
MTWFVYATDGNKIYNMGGYQSRDLAEMIAEQFRAVGLEVKVKPITE